MLPAAALVAAALVVAGCGFRHRALAVRTVAPDDELLAAELARLDGKLEAVDAGRRRLLDVYQASLVELPELQRRATEVERRRHDLGHRRGALTTQRQELIRDNQLRRRVRDFATRVLAVIDTLDFDTRNTSTPETGPAPSRCRRRPRHRLARPHPDTEPLDDIQPAPANPNPDPDQPDPVSTQDPGSAGGDS